MVPAHNLMAVRTVEDVVIRNSKDQVEVLGTKIGDEVLSTDRDTLFPLQAALGYEITQSRMALSNLTADAAKARNYRGLTIRHS
jgi:hypothetical protein